MPSNSSCIEFIFASSKSSRTHSLFRAECLNLCYQNFCTKWTFIKSLMYNCEKSTAVSESQCRNYGIILPTFFLKSSVKVTFYYRTLLKIDLTKKICVAAVTFSFFHPAGPPCEVDTTTTCLEEIAKSFAKSTNLLQKCNVHYFHEIFFM